MSHVCTIDSNIWILNFSLKNKGSKNVRNWFKEYLNEFSKIKLSTIIPLEIIHNLTKDPRIDFEIPFSYVKSIISYKKVELIELSTIELISTMNKLSSWRSLGLGSRDAVILNHLSPSDTVITHDKNILMVEEFNRIDITFDPPLQFKRGEKFDPDRWETALEN